MPFSLSLLTAPISHEPQLLDLDATVFVQLGLFVLVVFALTRFLWGPYLRVRSERTTRVEGYRSEAQRLESEADARLARAEAALAEARKQGGADRAAARADAQAHEQVLLAEAQADAQKALREATGRLNSTLTQERAKLQTVATAVGREAARKILGREVSA
jgi:F-type H+-transporting ATPase subunit b